MVVSTECYDVTVDLYADNGDRENLFHKQAPARFNRTPPAFAPAGTIMLQLQRFLVLVLIVGTSVTAGKYQFW